jgi:hypothetical protein
MTARDLSTEARAQMESADRWWANPQLEYAVVSGARGDRYHLATCRLIQSAVRVADRGERRYPVRLSMDEINART